MNTIFTIGTQGMNDDTFLAVLKAHDVDALIDIRLHNEGKWYRFASGKHIREICRASRIGYVHDTRFAPTREMLQAWREGADWACYEVAYRRLAEDRAMVWLFDEVAVGYERPCLLCAEKTPEQCHRRLLAEILARPHGAVVHL